MCYYIKYAQKGLPCQVHSKNKWHSHIVTINILSHVYTYVQFSSCTPNYNEIDEWKAWEANTIIVYCFRFLYLLFRLHPTCYYYYYHYYKVGIGCISF